MLCWGALDEVIGEPAMPGPDVVVAATLLLLLLPPSFPLPFELLLPEPPEPGLLLVWLPLLDELLFCEWLLL